MVPSSSTRPHLPGSVLAGDTGHGGGAAATAGAAGATTGTGTTCPCAPGGGAGFGGAGRGAGGRGAGGRGAGGWGTGGRGVAGGAGRAAGIDGAGGASGAAEAGSAGVAGSDAAVGSAVGSGWAGSAGRWAGRGWAWPLRARQRPRQRPRPWPRARAAGLGCGLGCRAGRWARQTSQPRPRLRAGHWARASFRRRTARARSRRRSRQRSRTRAPGSQRPGSRASGPCGRRIAGSGVGGGRVPVGSVGGAAHRGVRWHLFGSRPVLFRHRRARRLRLRRVRLRDRSAPRLLIRHLGPPRSCPSPGAGAPPLVRGRAQLVTGPFGAPVSARRFKQLGPRNGTPPTGTAQSTAGQRRRTPDAHYPRTCCRWSRCCRSRRCWCRSWPRARGRDRRAAGRRPLRRGARLAAAAPRWIAVGADAGGRRTVAPRPAARSSGSASTSSSAWPRTRDGPVDPALPLPLLIAGWLPRAIRSRSAASWSHRTPRPRSAARSASSSGPRTVGLLVVGDGAATHTEKAPGHLDERAGPFDAAVAAALRDADPAALAALDPELAAQLLAAGRAPWQVLAGAAGGPVVARGAAALGGAVRRRLPRRGLGAPGDRHGGSARRRRRADRHRQVRPRPSRWPHELGGEVVNADAMQLYRGMDIGTAKLAAAERAGVPHHLLDVLDVTETASVAAYQRAARAVIERLRAAGRTPVLVGGVRALRAGRARRAGVPRHRPGAARRAGGRAGRVRARRRCTPGSPTLDPAAAAVVLPGNGRRIVRALEVIALTGRPFPARLPEPRTAPLRRGAARRGPRRPPSWTSGSPAGWRGCSPPGWSTRRAGCCAARAARRAAPRPGRWATSRCSPPLDGTVTCSRPRRDTVRATRRFVRRQRSWFRRDRRIPGSTAPRPDLLPTGPGRVGVALRVDHSDGRRDVQFSKGHGTENDFVVLPDPDGVLDLTAGPGRRAVRPQRGLGADGVLRVVRWAALDDASGDPEPGVEWFMDYRNADGSVAEMCGNGVRVFARYLADAGLARAAATFATRHPRRGARRARRRRRGRRSDMGPATVGGASHRDDRRARLPRRRRRRRQPAPGLRHRRRAVDALDLTRAPGHDRGAVPARGERRVRLARASTDAITHAGARARRGGDPLLRHRHGRGGGGRAARTPGATPAPSPCTPRADGCGSPSSDGTTDAARSGRAGRRRRAAADSWWRSLRLTRRNHGGHPGVDVGAWLPR